MKKDNVMEEFVKTQGTLVYQGDIFETPKFSRAQVRKEVVKRKALFARWTSDFDSEKYDDGYAAAGKGWWYCLRQGTIDIDSLTAKQRYRVRRGLQNNNCYIATPEHIDEIQDELYDSYKASLADYPEVYKNVQSKEKLISWVRSAANSDRMDIWICRDKASGKVIGFAHVCSDAPLFHLSTVKLDPAYFKGEVNASLVYCIVNQYLGGGYLLDGQRNISHITNYQSFLVSVLNFRKVPCCLNIVYHPLVLPIVKILYPFRNLLKRMQQNNRLIFKIYSLLFQEQCARESHIY